MKKFDPFKNLKLDPEEQELLRSVEAGEWRSVKNVKKVMRDMQKAAQYTKARKQQINLRVSLLTLKKIKQKAAIEGIPYQTLIGSVLHKYALGIL